jgi:hypothetical protein
MSGSAIPAMIAGIASFRMSFVVIFMVGFTLQT